MKSNMKSGYAILALAAMSVLYSCSTQKGATVLNEGSEVEYSLSLFKNLLSVCSENENVTVSPYSAGVALSMLAEGAEGTTLAELDKALLGCRFMTENLSSSDSVTITSANSLWTNQNYPLKTDYTRVLAEQYYAHAQALDFALPSSVDMINSWVSENTAGKIGKVVDKLGPDMVAMLANALYFKGSWESPFEAKDTRKRTFHGVTDDSKVSFMNQTSVYDYAEVDGHQMIRIPYEGGKYAMTVVLPSEKMKLSKVEDYMCEANLDRAYELFERTRVKLSLPKFEVDGDMSLIPVLQKMGVNAAFTSSAEFGGIADGPLMVSDVNQKTYVNVDERGSEAAAVTTIGIFLTGMPMDDLDVKVMNVDRPFYYMISDIETGRILFIGRICNL